MKPWGKFAAALLFVAMMAAPVAAQDSGLGAAQMLDKVDDAVNGAKDQKSTMTLVLIDKNGKEATRELVMYQKGRDRRLAKFLSPADQRGIAFLSLPDDVQYVYLPAFGKSRRIASSVKNTSFAGTDFTYEDMQAVRMSDLWNAKIADRGDTTTTLELTPKPTTKSEYSKILITFRNDTYFPIETRHFDAQGNLEKIMTREDLKQVQGFWVAGLTVMKDLKKNHTTKMILSNVELNSGLGDDIFTERYLSR